VCSRLNLWRRRERFDSWWLYVYIVVVGRMRLISGDGDLGRAGERVLFCCLDTVDVFELRETW
jgi:hypothetical protein